MTTEQPVTEEKAATEEAQEETQPGLVEVLKGYDGSPTQEQIDAWKGQYGEIFVSGFSEDDLYIWRPITRGEWRDLQTRVQSPEEELTQLDFEELVCSVCVLWQASKTSLKLKGGTATTLHEQVLQNSNFVAPQAAQMFVARL